MANNLDPVFTPRPTKDTEQNLNNEQLKNIIKTLLERIQKLEQR